MRRRFVTIALTVFLIFSAIFVHELGHALVMQKYGIPLQTFSIGLPFPIKLTFSSKRILGGATLQFTPFLLGAYVKPTEEGAKKLAQLPYGEQADVYAAGPLANIMFGGFLWFSLALMKLGPGLFYPPVLYRSLVFVGIPALLFFARKIFSRYLFLPLGIAVAVLLAWTMLHAPQAMSGPVGIAKAVGKTHTVLDAFIMAINISFSLGVINAIPLLPLDGGKVMNNLIARFGPRVQNVYAYASFALLILLFGYIYLSDFFK